MPEKFKQCRNLSGLLLYESEQYNALLDDHYKYSDLSRQAKILDLISRYGRELREQYCLSMCPLREYCAVKDELKHDINAPYYDTAKYDSYSQQLEHRLHELKKFELGEPQEVTAVYDD